MVIEHTAVELRKQLSYLRRDLELLTATHDLAQPRHHGLILDTDFRQRLERHTRQEQSLHVLPREGGPEALDIAAHFFADQDQRAARAPG